MLALQARALLTVLAAPQRSGGVAAVRRLPVGQVIAELFAHEQAWWEASAGVERWGLSGLGAETLQRGILALALCGASDEDAAVRALRQVPDLSDAPEAQVRNVARWVEGLYPAAGGGVRIKPDVFGDWFLADRLTRQPTLCAALMSGLDETELRWALAVLTRAAGVFPAVLPVLAQLWQAAGDEAEVVIQLLLVHHTAQIDEQFAAFVRAVDLPMTALESLDERLPAYELPRSKAAVARRLVTGYRALASDNPAHQPDRARALSNLGNRLAALGEHQRAYEAASEAATLWRTLAADNPAHQPDLANALNSLGNRLSALGEHRAAYEAASEAATLWRTLAADNPAHQPDLAHTLSNLGGGLAALGEHRAAYEAASEAVTLYRTLAADNPAHQPNLARTLNNLGNRLCELGEHNGEFRFRREALKLSEMLAERDADLYGAGYQHALANLQGVYVSHGQEDRAARLGVSPKPRAPGDHERQPSRPARPDRSPGQD